MTHHRSEKRVFYPVTKLFMALALLTAALWATTPAFAGSRTTDQATVESPSDRVQNAIVQTHDNGNYHRYHNDSRRNHNQHEYRPRRHKNHRRYSSRNDHFRNDRFRHGRDYSYRWQSRHQHRGRHHHHRGKNHHRRYRRHHDSRFIGAIIGGAIGYHVLR